MGNINSIPQHSPSHSSGTSAIVSQRYTDPQSRIVVDIRGANLENNYSVWVRRTPTEQGEQHNFKSVTNSLQSFGGVLITLLTIQKLWEEVRFIRSLRGELASFASSLADGEAPHFGGAREGRGARTMDVANFSLLSNAAASSNPNGSTTWDKIAGLMEVKLLIQEATVLPLLRPDMFMGIRQPPRGILLFGPPGSGKTMLARAVATESRSSFIAVTGSNILSMWFGESEKNVKALFQRARQQQPAVIFIDEVDSLLGKRSGGPMPDSMPDKRVTNEFLAFIDGIQTCQDDSRIVIMAATNNPWDLDEAALSRFARRIYVPLPDKHSRADLLKKAMGDVPADISHEQYLQLADKCSNYSGRDLTQICREASMRPLRELYGKRLLESSSEQVVVEQRMVGMLTEYLRQGKPLRKLRKELEAWKRRQKGGADWCDIDGILMQAEQAAARLVHTASTAAGDATTVAAAAGAAAAAHKLAGGVGREACAECSEGCSMLPCVPAARESPDSALSLHAPDAAAASPPPNCSSHAAPGSDHGPISAPQQYACSTTESIAPHSPAVGSAPLLAELSSIAVQQPAAKAAQPPAAQPAASHYSKAQPTIQSHPITLHTATSAAWEEEPVTNSSSEAAVSSSSHLHPHTCSSLTCKTDGSNCSTASDAQAESNQDASCSSTPSTTYTLASHEAVTISNTEIEACTSDSAVAAGSCRCRSTSASSTGSSSTANAANNRAAPSLKTPLSGSSDAADAAADLTQQPAKASSSSPAKPGKQKPAGSNSNGSSSATQASDLQTWTVEELLALPVDKVRSVKMEDFEYALKQIMPALDSELNSRYEEWNSRYGSGSDSKASPLPRYSTMYL